MRRVLIAFALIVPTAAPAAWHAANPAVEIAVKDPLIAEVLAATVAIDDAILAGNRESFGSAFAADVAINDPSNRVGRKADAVRAMGAGMIDYHSLDRHIEFAARRGDNEVILMGEEWVTPRGKARDAGLKVKRRTTELWSKDSGRWLLVLRHATIYERK